LASTISNPGIPIPMSILAFSSSVILFIRLYSVLS
jgi:hypothetical protein